MLIMQQEEEWKKDNESAVVDKLLAGE